MDGLSSEKEVLRAAADEEAVARVLGMDLALLYKHSPACWQSFRAIGHVRRFAREEGAPPVFIVDVIGQRPLSRWIEGRVGIRHESPQVLLVRQGEVVWHGSHGAVRYERLQRALAAARGRNGPARADDAGDDAPSS